MESNATNFLTPKPINHVKDPKAKILFLGYNKTQTKIIEAMINYGCEVWHTDDKINESIASTYDLIISFGYRHILKHDIIKHTKAPIINLHIAYLPYNRGAHPNFWSFYESTPSGVSIHLIDEGIDTGPILYQAYVNFKQNETTFTQTYKRLISEIEDLFITNLDQILSNKFTPYPQRGKGTYHRLSDLPKEFSGWDADIKTEINRLDLILARGTA